MKQILQSPRTGSLELVDVPAPSPGRGKVLVRNHYSVVSPGTERMAMEFARKTLLGKARSRPDLVQQVTRKMQQEGPLSTYRAVMSRLDAPQPLGYSCAGVVEEVGPGVRAFAPGDRVGCGGAGYANHAELVVVPENLVVHVPDSVSLEHAAFVTLGAIALQGLRVAEPTLGEIAAVIGLGLIGQLAVQLLRSNGCRVLGIDIDAGRTKQVEDMGAEWAFTTSDLPTFWKEAATGGHGVDLAMVAASSESAAPIQLAAELSRMKGRISVVGAMPMDLDRRTFYDKQLELRMSTSYGPGRYDRNYEEGGIDYPLPYVRWTENRNMQAFLALLASRSVRPDLLDTKVEAFNDAERVYEQLAEGEVSSVAAVFRYDVKRPVERSLPIARARRRAVRKGDLGIAFLGAGVYAKGVLLPALARMKGLRRAALVTATGSSAQRTGERFKFAVCGTDAAAAIDDPSVGLVFVATQHDSHASLAARALRAGKAVWLEKPVGMRPEEVDDVAAAARESGGFLVVGYNRRFSPHARAARKALAGRQGPLVIRYTVAAGPPPRGSWVTDPSSGGGRIVGEVCHFVDLCAYLVGQPPSTVYARSAVHDPESDDSMISILGFADGSTATIEYLARASGELPKERFEASADGRTVESDNFRVTRVVGGERFKTFNQDKGQETALAEVIEAVRMGRPSPFDLAELVAVSRATFAMIESAATRREIRLDV